MLLLELELLDALVEELDEDELDELPDMDVLLELDEELELELELIS